MSVNTAAARFFEVLRRSFHPGMFSQVNAPAHSSSSHTPMMSRCRSASSNCARSKAFRNGLARQVAPLQTARTARVNASSPSRVGGAGARAKLEDPAMSIDTKPEPHDEASPFLMTPAQHRERAEEMMEAGRPDLARQHENLARLIDRRRQQQSK